MRIVFANYIAFPLAFGALFMLYYAWQHDGQGALYIVPFLFLAAMVWVLAPQINWWWYSKHPPLPEDGVIHAVGLYVPFYQRLNAAGKTRFLQRLALTRMGTEFIPKNMPDDAVLPPDLQAAISVQSVIVTWSKPEFILKAYEKIVVSPGGFFSPAFPYPHQSELHAPEQCMLLSARAVMDAFIQPKAYFNVALYEYVNAYSARYGALKFPVNENLWADLEAISGWNRQMVETQVGIAGLDVLPVAACHYLVFYSAFKTGLPALAQYLDTYFEFSTQTEFFGPEAANPRLIVS